MELADEDVSEDAVVAAVLSELVGIFTKKTKKNNGTERFPPETTRFFTSLPIGTSLVQQRGT